MSKPKYRPGEKLSVAKAVEAIAEGNFIYMRHKIYHCGWSQGWPIRLLIHACKTGSIREAIKTGEA